MSRLKDALRLLLPPVLTRLGSRLLATRFAGGKGREWEYVPDGWSYATMHPEVKGWNVQDVLDTYKQKWPQFVSMVEGLGPLGVAHESDLTTNADVMSHNTIMVFAYVLALTARTTERLAMLDWGGGIGHYCLLAQALLPGVEIEYHCKDVPLLAEYGARLFPRQHFCADESCLERGYDLVMASTSLHYAEDWRALLRRLAGATRGFLYVANVPTVWRAPSFVFLQRAYRYGYNTEYLGWCLNHAEFISAAESAGLEPVREFVYGHRPPIHGAPEQNSYWGYLFRAHTEDSR